MIIDVSSEFSIELGCFFFQHSQFHLQISQISTKFTKFSGECISNSKWVSLSSLFERFFFLFFFFGLFAVEYLDSIVVRFLGTNAQLWDDFCPNGTIWWVRNAPRPTHQVTWQVSAKENNLISCKSWNLMCDREFVNDGIRTCSYYCARCPFVLRFCYVKSNN